MAQDQNAIVVQGLKKSYKKLQVLKGIDFAVKKGTILALLGPNGAGKTTTVKILSTLLLPDGGKGLINGFDVVKQADKVRSQIGLTGQYAAVDEYLTGEENLLMMGRLYRLEGDQVKKRTRELLKQFDLDEASGRTVKTYSGGMKRRLDLAASLIASPPVIFLDEPTTGLDPRSRLTMWEIIEELVAGGTTILLTTQYMDEADRLAHNIVVIDGGKVIAEGTADKLKQQVGSELLEIIISQKSSFDGAKKLLNIKGANFDGKRRTVTVATKGGTKELQQILNRLTSAKIEVESVSLHKPTLDDVFMSLTGHLTTEEKEEQSKKNNKKGK